MDGYMKNRSDAPKILVNPPFPRFPVLHCSRSHSLSYLLPLALVRSIRYAMMGKVDMYICVLDVYNSHPSCASK